MNQTKPNFFVVGAAKAGTSSLYNWLGQHPEVCVPTYKEPSYFTENYGYSDFQEYLKLFEASDNKKAIVDTSATYLAAPEVPERIFKTFGEVKIIIILRNPVKRAYSLYSWMLMEGYERIRHFERALVEEDTRFYNKDFYVHNPEYFWDYMYFRSGLYYEQVKRYLDIFGKENVRIYLFDDLIKDSLVVFRDLCVFMGVSAAFEPTFLHENKSLLPKFVAMQYFLLITSPRYIVKFPKRLHRFLWRSRETMLEWNKMGNPVPPLDMRLGCRLRAKYQHDIKKLGELLGMNLSSWTD